MSSSPSSAGTISATPTSTHPTPTPSATATDAALPDGRYCGTLAVDSSELPNPRATFIAWVDTANKRNLSGEKYVVPVDPDVELVIGPLNRDTNSTTRTPGSLKQRLGDVREPRDSGTFIRVEKGEITSINVARYAPENPYHECPSAEGASKPPATVHDVDCGAVRAGSPPLTFGRVQIVRGAVTCEQARSIATTYVKSGKLQLSVDGWSCSAYEGQAFACRRGTSESDADQAATLVEAGPRRRDGNSVSCGQVRLDDRAFADELRISGPTTCKEATRVADGFAMMGRPSLTTNDWHCVLHDGEGDPFACIKNPMSDSPLRLTYGLG